MQTLYHLPNSSDRSPRATARLSELPTTPLPQTDECLRAFRLPIFPGSQAQPLPLAAVEQRADDQLAALVSDQRNSEQKVSMGRGRQVRFICAGGELAIQVSFRLAPTRCQVLVRQYRLLKIKNGDSQ